MAKCIQCSKRCNTRMGCFYCGRGPMCLDCRCPCRTPEAKAAIVARVLDGLDQKRDTASRKESRDE